MSSASTGGGWAVSRTARTGVEGLDQILAGGLTRGRMYLIEGLPGSGKTTLAMQFLLAGRDHGEPCMYVALSETAEDLRAIAASHGWSLEGIEVFEIMPSQESVSDDQHYTLFHPAEVELGETATTILVEVERIKPVRVVFDSLSELRMLAGSALHYRRQVLALKRFFAGRNCTVILLDDVANDFPVQSLVHGAIDLEQIAVDYGAERRRLRVVKYRGVRFRGGYHDFMIRRGGLEVFPHLAALPAALTSRLEVISTGIEGLDAMLGGGIQRGTSTLITGPAGTGKSSIAARCATAAAERGECAALFLFDESPEVLLARAAGLGIDLERHVKSRQIAVEQINPTELSPGEFACRVAAAAEKAKASVVVIDSLSGYLNAMPDERFLIIQLHQLLMFLGRRGIATVLVAVQHGLIGSHMSASADTSYLADTVILMRFFEAFGRVRQAISVIKRRGGEHERSIREFNLRPGAIEVGKPLTAFRGVLTGVPEYLGEDAPLIKD